MADTSTELEQMKSFYDGVYYTDDDKPLQGSAHLNKLAQMIGVSTGDQVRDIACGLGEWLHVCETARADVHGIDLSRRAIDYCRKHMPKSEFHAQAAKMLPFETGQKVARTLEK